MSSRIRNKKALRRVGLAQRLLAIGKDCAAHIKEPFRSLEHGDLLYDERGLPKDRDTQPNQGEP